MRLLHAVGLFLTLIAVPASSQAGSSNSLMDVSPDGARLLVVNSDNGSVSVVDTAGKKKLVEVAVGKKPEGVSWIGNGPLAVVTVYAENRLAFVDTVEGKVVGTLAVPAEPYGIIATPDGKTAYVTHEYPGLVTEIDVASRTVMREMPVGKFVRGLAFSADRKAIYVTEFYTANLVAVDVASGKVTDRWPAQSVDNLARHVVVHPSRPKAYVSHIRSRIDVIDGSGSIFPHLTIFDLVPVEKDAKRRRSVAMDTYNGVYVVTNPWEAALTSDGTKIYTIYAGTNDMNVSNVVDDDYKEIDRRGLAVSVGQNPRAVRVSPDDKTVYVSNALDFDVSFLDANTLRPLGRVKVCDPPKSPEWVRGKILFNTAQPPLTGRRWISCSSCHPDGHTDGRVWQNPEGMRKTSAMMGMGHTYPLHWSADRDEAQDFEYTIQGRLMQGRGFLGLGQMKRKTGFEPIELEEVTGGRNKDLDALAIYSNSFEFPLSPHNPAPGKLSPEAERGKALFFAKEVGCATCHSGPYFTDSRLQKPFNLHDVGTGKDDPSEKIGPKYDTPTLLGVYRTAPYLHHGKAATLEDVLTTSNKGDRHGKTSQLKPGELADLVSFLKALPYEMPPDETPNSVKYRLLPAKKE